MLTFLYICAFLITFYSGISTQSRDDKIGVFEVWIVLLGSAFWFLFWPYAICLKIKKWWK